MDKVFCSECREEIFTAAEIKIEMCFDCQEEDFE